MAENLSLISIISFGLAVVCLLLAICFWIKFNIPKIIGDLSGRTAKKSIARMREKNEKTGRKTYHPVMKQVVSSATSHNEQQVTIDSDQTEILQEDNQETDMFVCEETMPLTRNETDVLECDETQKLYKEPKQTVVRKQVESSVTIMEDLMIIHSDEVIEG